MPARPITSLIYVSTAQAGLGLDDFMDILTVAQRNNRRFGITGLLVFNGTNFMQCLEGDRSSTNDRLHQISADERHSGLVVLSRTELPNRQFTGWHMAGRYLPSKNGPGQTDLSELLADTSVSGTTRQLFQSFRSLGAGIAVG